MIEKFVITEKMRKNWGDLNPDFKLKLWGKRISDDGTLSVSNIRWQRYADPVLTLLDPIEVPDSVSDEYMSRISNIFGEADGFGPEIISFFLNQIKLAAIIQDNYVGQDVFGSLTVPKKVYLVGQLPTSEAPPWITVRIGAWLDSDQSEPCLEILALNPNAPFLTAVKWASSYDPNFQRIVFDKKNYESESRSSNISKGLFVPQAIKESVETGQPFAESYARLTRKS